MVSHIPGRDTRCKIRLYNLWRKKDIWKEGLLLGEIEMRLIVSIASILLILDGIISQEVS
jgi:hypothetical protein